MKTPATRRASPGASAWWRRLLLATLVAYLAGYLVQAALGNTDPRKVGWGASFAPVLAEGAVFAFVLGGVWGVVLAPLPLLLAPETWVRLGRTMDLLGPYGLLLLAHPVPAMWAAGIVGAMVRRLVPWLVL